jgi:hypothetical protein
VNTMQCDAMEAVLCRSVAWLLRHLPTLPHLGEALLGALPCLGSCVASHGLRERWWGRRARAGKLWVGGEWGCGKPAFFASVESLTFKRLQCEQKMISFRRPCT